MLSFLSTIRAMAARGNRTLACVSGAILFLAWGLAPALAEVRVRQLGTSVSARSSLAIVLVHGFNSSADDGFRNPAGKHWSDIILGDARPLVDAPSTTGITSLAGATLYSVDYSSLTNTTAASADVSIEDISRSIIDKDDFRAIFRNHRYVWIVTHSMGGVVTKRTLIKLHAAEPEAWRRLLGISLIAVPANGAPLANRGTETALGRFFRSVWGVSERQLRELAGIDGGNSYLQAMRTDWAVFVDAPERRGRFYLACAYDGLPTPVAGLGITLTEKLVVPQLYADTKCVGEDARISANHAQIVKPTSQEAAIHEWFFTTVRIALRNDAQRASDGPPPKSALSPRAISCAAAKDEPEGATIITASDDRRKVTARRTVPQPDASQSFTAIKVAEEQAKADLIRFAQQHVSSARFTSETDGRLGFRETVRSLAEGNLAGVRIVQSCYIEGMAWVRIEHDYIAR